MNTTIFRVIPWSCSKHEIYMEHIGIIYIVYSMYDQWAPPVEVRNQEVKVYFFFTALYIILSHQTHDRMITFWNFIMVKQIWRKPALFQYNFNHFLHSHVPVRHYIGLFGKDYIRWRWYQNFKPAMGFQIKATLHQRPKGVAPAFGHFLCFSGWTFCSLGDLGRP